MPVTSYFTIQPHSQEEETITATLSRKDLLVCSVAVLCVAVIGCSSSDDSKSADLERQLDMEKAARMTAEQERDAAKTAQTTAEQERDAAKTAQTTAEQERDAAKTAQTTAEQERDAAKTAQTTAEQERDAAKTAQTTAEQERDTAKTAQTTAEEAQAAAEAARMTAEQAVDAMRNAAVTNAIEKIAAPGQPHRCALDTGCGSDSGVDYSSVSITHDVGYRDHGERLIHAIPWRGDDGQVEFIIRIIPEPLQRGSLDIWTFTDLRTPDRNGDVAGNTTSVQPDRGSRPWIGMARTRGSEGV